MALNAQNVPTRYLSHPARLGRVLDGLLLALSLGLAVYGQAQLTNKQLPRGVLAFGLAAVLFVWVLRRAPLSEPATPARRPSTAPPGVRWAGVALLGLSAACSALALAMFIGAPPTNTGWALYLLSLPLFAGGFMLLDWWPRRAGVRSVLVRLRALRWELLAVFVLVAGGALLRFTGLEILPFGVWFDESDNGVWAREILTNPMFRPFYVGSTNLPAHFLYLIALAFKVFGISAGAIRWVTALFGTATIVAMWLLGRELGGRWSGLLAAGLTAFSHWAINFSRLGMHGITTPFFAASTAYLFLRGLRRGSRPTIALGGLSLGVGLCFYAPFRIFPFVIVVYLLGKLATERGFLKRGWELALIFMVASILGFAPVGQYALAHQDEFFGRTKQTSVFAGKTPEQGREALKSNIVRHTLMFNYEGDRNGRHNLPGEPMLDAVTGILFPLGVALALSKLHRPRQLFLAVWMGAMLCGGILSLDFEAPQSLRSIGSMPAAFLLIAQAVPLIVEAVTAPLAKLSVRWPRWVGVGLLSAVVCAGLGYSVWLNYDIYFVQQARNTEVFHSYNAREAVVARRFEQDAGRYRFYTIYEGHPTVRFLAPVPVDRDMFQAIDDLPVRGQVERDVLYILEAEFAPPTELFQAWYPGGSLQWYVDPAGVPMLYSYEITKDEINATQGLIWRLFAAEDHEQAEPLREERLDRIDARWDELAPAGEGRAEWAGQLYVPDSGTYGLHLLSTGTASLTLDDEMLPLPEGGTADERLVLAKGWHPLRLVADVAAGGEVKLEWTTPAGLREVIPRDALHASSELAHGLYAFYYPGMDWNGLPAFARVDWQVDFRWHIQPLSTPFSVEWQGALKIDQPGTYSLILNSNAGSSLELNNTMLVDNLTPPHGNRETPVLLEQGLYPIRVRYHENDGYSFMRLYWRRPDGTVEPIPAQNLAPRPPADVNVPGFTLPEPAPEQPAPSAAEPASVEGAEAELVRMFAGTQDLETPRAIAVGADGRVFVSDNGKKAVVVFDAQGQREAEWGVGSMQEPSDLAAAPDGSLYALDAGASRVVHFGADGSRLGELGADLGLYGPRGLALLADGRLAIADTGSNRVILLNPADGTASMFGSAGTGPVQFQQPADVAFTPEGNLAVIDTLLNKRVQVCDTQGALLTQWLTPWASDFAAAASAAAADGRLFMADTDQGRVWEYSPDGAQAVWWRGGDLRRPVGLSLGTDGLIYLVDEETRRVYVFQR